MKDQFNINSKTAVVTGGVGVLCTNFLVIPLEFLTELFLLLIWTIYHVKILSEIQSIYVGSFWIKHRRAWLK